MSTKGMGIYFVPRTIRFISEKMIKGPKCLEKKKKYHTWILRFAEIFCSPLKMLHILFRFKNNILFYFDKNE